MKTKNIKFSNSTLSPSSARYYNSSLSIWLSVDPLADKSPNLSPYTYCAGNPVRLVDPDGRELGEYYDMQGKWLGSDGRNDFRVYFVKDPKSQAQLRNDAKNNKYTTSSIKSELTTSTYVLNEIIDVFDRTAGGNNKGQYEEGSAFMYDILLPYRSERGTMRHVNLKLNSGSTSIHSHTFVEFLNDNGESRLFSPEVPSDDDRILFAKFTLNVIVGRTNCDQNVEGCRRYDKAYFYNNSTEEILNLEIEKLRGIAWESSHSFHLPK